MKTSFIPIVELVRIRLPNNLKLSSMSLPYRKEKTSKRVKPILTLENGLSIMLENGGRILIEKNGTKLYRPLPPTIPPLLLLENGNRILQEDGYIIKLENNN